MIQTVKQNLGTLLIVIAIVIGSNLNAQPPGDGGQRGGQQGPPSLPNTKEIKEMVSKLADEIALTAEQEEDVLALYTEHFKEVKSQISSSSRPSREKMEKLKSEFEEEVKEVLSKEQQTKYMAYLKKQSQNRPQRR